MYLFLTKVVEKNGFMGKHFKRQRFTQAICLHIMLNISKHYLVRNGDHLPKVCVAC